jgi:energy-coupling factor transport system ATP-binding protein
MLVLDEPTFGQDAVTWAGLVEMIGELRADGHAIIASTHDAEFVTAIGAHVLRLDAASAADATEAAATDSAAAADTALSLGGGAA